MGDCGLWVSAIDDSNVVSNEREELGILFEDAHTTQEVV